MEIDKAMLRQSDGTLVSDDSLSKVTLWGVNGTLPKRITNIGSFSGNLAQMQGYELGYGYLPVSWLADR